MDLLVRAAGGDLPTRGIEVEAPDPVRGTFENSPQVGSGGIPHTDVPVLTRGCHQLT
jgi:hypothetical protein